MDGSPLNCIPAEIRIRIYELLLLSPHGLFFECARPGETSRLDFKFQDPSQKNDALALIATSRQVRQETLPILFESNKVSLGCRIFDKPHSTCRIAVAQETSSALLQYPFTQYMKDVLVHLGEWSPRKGAREDDVIAETWETLKHLAEAFPSPKIRLSCRFEVQWPRSDFFSCLEVPDGVSLRTSRGRPESLIEDIGRAVVDQRQMLRRYAPEQERKLMRAVKRSAGKIASLAHLMEKNPMWRQACSESTARREVITDWDDGEDDGKDNVKPVGQGPFADYEDSDEESVGFD